MIIVRISGGIGNQLFQYALGRALSLKNNKELKIDTHLYSLNIEPNRSFKLPYFNIPNLDNSIATNDDFKKIGTPNPIPRDLFSRLIRKGFRCIEYLKPINKKKIILEPTFDFIPGIMKIKDDCYLSGVWQTEKYFKEYETIIRHDFTLKNNLSSKAQELKALVESSTSIAVHIRRGDMVNNPILSKKYGKLDQEYYSKALEYIRQNINDPQCRIFVFSDEIEWVKKSMDFGSNPIYVSEYKIPDYEELIIMSSCKHNIIARSSYSWWGAWLNTNPDKIVIAPRQHLGDPSSVANDLIPASWIKM